MARNVEELDVYQRCDEVRRLVRPLLERPLFKKDWDLHDQITRSSEGPCPNLAEGFSRYYPKDNARFVRVARGSLHELIVHIGRALAKGYIDAPEHDTVVAKASAAKQCAAGYIRYLETAETPRPPSARRRRPRPKRERRSSSEER